MAQLKLDIGSELCCDVLRVASNIRYWYSFPPKTMRRSRTLWALGCGILDSFFAQVGYQ